MSDPSPFQADSQTAIFNFLFVLVDEYAQAMPKPDAIEKACDWLISLGTTVKSQAETIRNDMAAKEKLFKETRNQD